MAGEREIGLRRCHAIGQLLLDVFVGEPLSVEAIDVPFFVSCPDSRVSVSLAVMFVPQPGRASTPPSDGFWAGMFDAGEQGLSIQGRRRAIPESNLLLPVDNVFGQPSTPVGLAGDVFGWTVSARPDADEWHGVLHFDQESLYAGTVGKWIATATFTDDTGGMTEEEWERLVERVYLRANPQRIELLPFAPG